MDKNQILTYAIMTVNNSHNRDYLDNFVPFVKEALRVYGSETISANELKENIKTLFNLNLPINVVNTILRRKLKPQGYIQLKNKMYIPDFEKLQDSNFNEVKQKMLEKHDRLIASIITYSKTKFNKDISTSIAEEALEAFIGKYQLPLLKSSLSRSPSILENPKSQNELDIIISSFVKDSFENKELGYEYLIDIVKGTVLSNVLYYNPEFDTIGMKFKGTEVFFDSTFIIYALGLSGKARQEPCLELLSMLKESNAMLKVFPHNIEEIMGILEYCKNHLTAGVSDYHGTISYFVSNGIHPSEIDRMIDTLEEDIKEKLRIHIVETPNYNDYKYIIDEDNLKKHLQKYVNYPRENALERDVQSVSSIIRLRKDRKSVHVENSRAVFITTNTSFAEAVKDYFFNEEMPKLIPPVLHDSVITNLVWLKKPSSAPDLPLKRLIGECYAATAPKEHLWQRYLETVSIVEETNKLTQEDIVLLRYTPVARELLIEKTLGDENVITIGTVQDILAEIKQKKENELKALEMQKEREINFLKESLERTKAEVASAIEEREKRISLIAQKRAKLTTLSITLTLSFIIGFLIYMVPFTQNLAIPNWAKIIILVILTIVPTVLGLLNINMAPLLKKSYQFFTDKYEERLKNKFL